MIMPSAGLENLQGACSNLSKPHGITTEVQPAQTRPPYTPIRTAMQASFTHTPHGWPGGRAAGPAAYLVDSTRVRHRLRVLDHRHRLSGEDGLVDPQCGGEDLHEAQVGWDFVADWGRQTS